MRVSDQLAQAEVRDTDGNAQPLGKLWQKGPVLLLWVRHFG